MTHGDASAKGCHVCYVAGADTASAAFLAAHARRGVRHGQRVLWAVDERRQGVIARLAPQDGDGASSDQVQFCSAEALYLTNGGFDVDRMLQRYRTGVESSRAAGYTGLRVLADTSWLTTQPEMLNPFLEYEHRINELFVDGGFSAVCHYGPQTMPADWLRALGEAHPMRADPLQPGALSAGLLTVSEAQDGGVVVSGEVDFGNADELRALLAEFTPPSGDLLVDVSRLDFIDVAGTRALVSAARTLGQGRRLFLHGGCRPLRVVLEMTGWSTVPELVFNGRTEHQTQ